MFETTKELFDFAYDEQRGLEVLGYENFRTENLHGTLGLLNRYTLDEFLTLFKGDDAELDTREQQQKWRINCTNIIRQYGLVSLEVPRPTLDHVLHGADVVMAPVKGPEWNWLGQWVDNGNQGALKGTENLRLVKAFHLQRFNKRGFIYAPAPPAGHQLRAGLHGTRWSNFFSILARGLLPSPPGISDAGSNYAEAIYGRGIYLADSIQNAAQYARNQDEPTPPGHKLLVFVALFNPGPRVRRILGNEGDLRGKWLDGETAREVIATSVPNEAIERQIDHRRVRIPIGQLVPSNVQNAQELYTESIKLKKKFKSN